MGDQGVPTGLEEGVGVEMGLTKKAHQVGRATQSRWPEKMEWLPILRGWVLGFLKMERRRRLVIWLEGQLVFEAVSTVLRSERHVRVVLVTAAVVDDVATSRGMLVES